MIQKIFFFDIVKWWLYVLHTFNFFLSIMDTELLWILDISALSFSWVIGTKFVFDIDFFIIFKHESFQGS